MEFGETVAAAGGPLELLTEEVVDALAAMPTLARAEAFARLRERWPDAGVWRDLRSAVTARRRELARPAPRRCVGCGAALPPLEGSGRPRLRCDACRVGA